MEVPTSMQAETIRIPEDEGTWRAHVKYAEDFRGSNAEYCRRNRIDHRVFRSYKKKFGATKARAGDPKAFVKIQAESQGGPKVETFRPRNKSLPDPRWTAEFIVALIAASQ